MRAKRIVAGAAFWCAAFVLGAGMASTHDVVHTMAKGDAIVVAAGYEGGGPMRYAGVTIYSPRDAKVEFQNGRTDARGVFAFVPDAPGDWKIVVDDENGHGFVSTFTVDRDLSTSMARKPYSWIKKLVTGLALLLGVTGILSYIQARKLRAEK